jgi:hypothetical protein
MFNIPGLEVKNLRANSVEEGKNVIPRKLKE